MCTGEEAMHMVEAVCRRGAANAVLVLWEQWVTETTPVVVDGAGCYCPIGNLGSGLQDEYG
jgi:hypothetical protein